NWRLRGRRSMDFAARRPRMGRGGAPDLLACQPSESRPDRVMPSAETPAVACEPSKVPIAVGHVRHGIEGRRAGEQRRMAGEEKQRLLAAHARPERVYAPWIDAQPGDHCRHDARHSCQVLDLTWIAPGEAFEPPALALGVDDR